MKLLTHIVILLLALTLAVRGALPVTDAALIATNRANAEREHLEQLVQGANQTTQILHLVDQIRQLDTYLERFGDPGSIRDLEALEDLIGMLDSEELNLPEEDLLDDLEGSEVFAPDPVYQAPAEKITIGGSDVGDRNLDSYKPQAATGRSVGAYTETRTRVLARRQALRANLSSTLEQVRSADTASEVQKLSVLIDGLRAQLAATDRELEIAATEASMRMLQAELQNQVKRKALVETERARLREGARKDIEIYRIDFGPILFNRGGK